MSEMRVVGVRVELPANQPILLLRETSGDRYLPIWIGSVEATAIALEQQGVKPARPLTHDLLKDVIAGAGAAAGAGADHRPAGRHVLRRAGLRRRREGVRPAERLGGARAADRACRSTPRRACSPRPGLIIPDEQEDEVEKFREFLDSISPEDFRGAQPS